MMITIFKKLEDKNILQQNSINKELNELRKSIQDIKVEFNKEIARVKKIRILMIAEMKNLIYLNLNLNGKHHQQNGPCVRQYQRWMGKQRN